MNQGDQGDVNAGEDNEKGNQNFGDGNINLNLNETIGSERGDQVLNCMHWNLNGESSSRYLLDYLIDESLNSIDVSNIFHFIALSETKLSKMSNIQFKQSFQSYQVISNSYEECVKGIDCRLNNPNNNKHGVALLYHCSLVSRIIPVKIKNPRFCSAVLTAGINYDIKVLIFAVYLPTFNKDQTEFITTLIDIQKVIEDQGCDRVIALGDWNVNEASHQQRKDFFKDWLENNSMSIDYPDLHTHRNYVHGTNSYLDGVALSNTLAHLIQFHYTLTEGRIQMPVTTSDHFPVWFRINIDIKDIRVEKRVIKEKYKGKRVIIDMVWMGAF